MGAITRLRRHHWDLRHENHLHLLPGPPRLQPGPRCTGSNEVEAREVRPRGKRKRVTTVAAKTKTKTKTKTPKGARKCKTAMG